MYIISRRRLIAMCLPSVLQSCEVWNIEDKRMNAFSHNFALISPRLGFLYERYKVNEIFLN